jgi:hypothetical protein
MSILPFFTWCDHTGISTTIKNSTYIFPIFEVFHLLSLAVISGAVLMINLRMLGFGVTQQPVGEVAAETRPYLIGSLLAMIATGSFLFIAEPMKCYEHGAFWYKMTSLLLAILFTFTVQRKVIASAGRKRATPLVMKTVAVVSLFLWCGVGIAGRWIGFS